jgi:dienelactone hydrolase
MPSVAARVVYALGALALLIGLIGLRQATHSVAHYAVTLPGGIPAVVWEPGEPVDWGARPREGPPLPVVVLAHDFASSKGMMSSLARRLARGGYAVVAFDFAGHGQNPAGFARGALIDDVDAAVLWVRTRQGFDGERVAVAGHSMGAGAVLSYASREPNVAATVAISGARPPAGPYAPPNLLMIWASGDPARLRNAARGLGAEVAGLERLVLDRTYGDSERGTGVHLTEVSGLDHVTILYSGEAAHRILDWLRQTLGPGDAPAGVRVSDGRFGWAALGAVGTLVVFFALPGALASITPKVEPPAPADPLVRLGLLFVSLVVAVLALSGADAASGRGPFDLIPLVVGRHRAEGRP